PVFIHLLLLLLALFTILSFVSLLEQFLYIMEGAAAPFHNIEGLEPE
ncbi:MAG: hypothetical protein GY816_13900, partial [Cytophagales bacterium]|nr:hypothetical protein [Cytophagales bacterium]